MIQYDGELHNRMKSYIRERVIYDVGWRITQQSRKLHKRTESCITE